MPALAYKTPLYYDCLSENEKKSITELSSDTCIIRYGDETNYFIRCVMLQDILFHEEKLNYGLWVSLSEQSFYDYMNNYDDKEREGKYFGWISNNLIGYDKTIEIPTDVVLGQNGNRPEVIPHKSFNHPFINDYYKGISLEEAHNRIAQILNKKIP
ncbi:DUF2199 domain-containing protein [Flavobacterium sp. Sd200]|uniref:DUF2199 domain-containing protein n=1 Tax=Flavobacterium sp. Sd200 TaxID=2692211 RepID=UPI001370E2C1|nr:DUF2199 domain-containing protein [Flavobacterium sp. Sd200]MXN93186.1 DUF2199 domain-containing protein [Flavobacterium sp. Sd200]